MRRIKGFYIYALAVICLLAGVVSAEDLTLNINVKKPIAIVSEKFLSITLDPVALFNTDFLSDVEKSTNMARALAPAYVRIAGPRSNSYVFERGLYPQETHPDPGLTFTETHWINLHQWAERSGLDVVACIAPQMSEGARAWDPRNALDLISFSDHMGYNTSWQLGYECQANCKASGAELGRDVARLRSMLDAFPRFAEAGLIAGPDVVTWRTKQEQQYLQEYLSAAATGLSALTWHPDFAGVSLEDDGVSMHYDNLAAEKDSLYKVIGRQVSKKPLWLAESKPEDCKRNFLGALVWARRLGNSAKLGAQVIMRQPDNSNFLRPTPDFWVSMLHKMLVGREVLDTKISSGNRTHIHFYTQCTKPSSRYEKGSITIFGLNLTPTKISASLRGLKIKNVHKYILLPGYDSPNRMFAETVLLNNDQLNLVNGKQMPEINPIIYNVDRDIKLKLPSGGIGFWVIPGLKVKSCMGPEDDIADRNIVRKANKRFEELEVEEDMEPSDDNSRDTPDVADSFEDRKSLLRHQLQRRLTARRSVRHKDIDRDDERNLRRGEGIKRDVRKHEKIGKKKEQYDDDSDAYATSGEKDENFEEAIERKILDGQSLDSGEEIRAKLHEYKRRLADHEYRKKQRGKTTTKERARDGADGVSNKNMDTGKVIEALTLITKVESAMKGLEKNNDTQQKLSLSPMLGSDDFSDVNPELKQGSKNDELLDEVLNTEKAKRTAVPTKIEDQLKALYRLLSEEKDKKDGSLSLRPRRDLDKRVGDDPLGLRRDSIFLRRRTEAKERRNERRQRIRERIEEHRRGRESTKKVQRDASGENNFYGFQYRAPLKNFPEGDLYLQGSAPAADQGNAPMKSVRAADEHQDAWLVESDGNHMPNEFYENVKRPGYDAKNNLKEYGELWEAEALHKDEDEKNVNGAVEYEIVTERQLTEAEDRKAKEKAVQQLINYYETSPQEQSYDFEEVRQKHMQAQHQPPQMQQLQPLPQAPSQQPLPQQSQPQAYYQQQMPVNYQQAVAAGNNLQQGSYYYPNQYPQQNRRAKRNLNELEDILHQEMIDQDDNNLRDCQCRVIRGIENCKDCQIQTGRQQEGTPLFMPAPVLQYPPVPINGQKIRVRRDTEEMEEPAVVVEGGADIPEAMAVIPEGAPGIPETIEPSIPYVNPGVLAGDEIDEAIAPISVDEGVEASALAERSAGNVELTMEDSKEDVPDVESSGPLKLDMNLEAEEEEPLGSRIARKTESSKLFRKKSKVSATTTSPKKKTKANKQENTANSETSAAKVESTGFDKSSKVSRSSGEGPVGAKTATLQATDPASTLSNTGNQAFNPPFAASVNQATSTGFITSANGPIAVPFIGVASQAAVTPFAGATNQSPAVGFINQPLTTTLTGAPIQAPPGGFVNSASQPLTVAFTGDVNHPGFINTAQQPLTTAFTGAVNQPSVTGFVSTANQPFATPNVNAQPNADSSAKSYESITIRTDKPVTKPTDAATKNKDKLGAKAIPPIASKINANKKDQSHQIGIKATSPVSSRTNQSDSQATAAFAKRQSTANAETTEAEKASSGQTVNSSVLNGTTTTKSEPAAKTTTTLQAKKLSSPPKANNTSKMDDAAKSRQARLTTRTEALAALRKENENRRTKKMIEASLKLLESESARFAEYEKRRREQLDRLKDKLRAKREKMLNQYKDELVEAIHNDDQKQSHLRRRDLVNEYSRTDDDSGFMNYSPIMEMRSLHDNDEYEESGKAKRSMPQDHSMEDEEEMYDTDAGEFREAFKRSPMVYMERNNNPQVMEGDSGEYYTPEQQRTLQQRVTEAQRRMYQQRQEHAGIHHQPGAPGQYPQVHYPYSPQNGYPNPPHMQQPYPPRGPGPYPPQRHQPYPPQKQQPYPQPPYPGTHMTGPHQPQQHHLTQHYPQNQQNGINTAPLYPPSPSPAVPQQYPSYPPSPASAQQPVIPTSTAAAQLPTDYKQGSKAAIVQQPQPYVQQPNAALYNQQSSVQPQQPGVDYYNQEPTATPQQPDASYYNYAPANTQQQATPQQPDASYYNYASTNAQQPETNVDYANQQTHVPPAQRQPGVDYYSHPTAEGPQYSYPPASTNSDYYKQYYASQQQVDANHKNLVSTPPATATGIEQPAVPQVVSNLQPAVPYQQTTAGTAYAQQPALPNLAVDQSQPIVTPQQISNAQLYDQKVENTENLQDLKVYQPAPAAEDSATPFDTNSYYQYYQNSNQQQQPQVNSYAISPTAYESIQQAPSSRPYKKAKRSNLKVLEINPSIYDDEDTDYNLRELFMKPSSRFSSRSSRSPSNPADNIRIRRGASVDQEEDGPLSIPLGLELSNMMPREKSLASSDGITRRKRQTEESEVSQSRSPVNKNIKKVYKSGNDKHKKTPKRLTQLRRIDVEEVTETIPRVRKLRLVEFPATSYLRPVKNFANNHLDDSKDIDTLLTRRRRSPDPKYEHGVRYNHIDRNADSDMNEIWNDLIEMKQDEALDEYDRSKDELFSDFLKDQKLDNLSIDDKKDSPIQKVTETTTKANIESIIVEAIPKLENVITGGIEKAQNLTGNLEDFIENFDEQFDETTAEVEETSESPEDINGGRLTHGVFKSMIGGVKKFFNFISGIGKIFRSH